MKKLTLAAQPEVIALAKKLARQQGTSVSAMFSQVVRAMAGGRPGRAGETGPITRRLTGIAKSPRRRTDRQLIEDALLREIRAVIETVFVDTNILLDVLLARRPFLSDAQRLWTLAEIGRVHAVVSSISFINVFYVVRRLSSRPAADRAVRGMQAIFRVAPIDKSIIDQAIQTSGADFEDAVQHACALHAGASCIITRDARHFLKLPTPVLAPDAFLAKFDAQP